MTKDSLCRKRQSSKSRICTSAKKRQQRDDPAGRETLTRRVKKRTKQGEGDIDQGGQSEVTKRQFLTPSQNGEDQQLQHSNDSKPDHDHQRQHQQHQESESFTAQPKIRDVTSSQSCKPIRFALEHPQNMPIFYCYNDYGVARMVLETSSGALPCKIHVHARQSVESSSDSDEGISGVDFMEQEITFDRHGEIYILTTHVNPNKHLIQMKGTKIMIAQQRYLKIMLRIKLINIKMNQKNEQNKIEVRFSALTEDGILHEVSPQQKILIKSKPHRTSFKKFPNQFPDIIKQHKLHQHEFDHFTSDTS